MGGEGVVTKPLLDNFALQCRFVVIVASVVHPFWFPVAPEALLQCLLALSPPNFLSFPLSYSLNARRFSKPGCLAVNFYLFEYKTFYELPTRPEQPFDMLFY